jgi:hypothetical protein
MIESMVSDESSMISIRDLVNNMHRFLGLVDIGFSSKFLSFSWNSPFVF